MRRVAIAILLVSVVAAGLHWGSFVAGGSDSYCYLHQAQRWASGRLQVAEPLALEAPWPDAPLTFAPAGEGVARPASGYCHIRGMRCTRLRNRRPDSG